MKIVKLNFLKLALILGLGCLSLTLSSQAIGQESYSGDEAGLERLAKDLNGNFELLKKLKPTAADIQSLTSSEESAKLLATYLDNLYNSIPESGIGGRANQTRIRLDSGKISEIKAGTDKNMPGGYRMTGTNYGDGFVLYSVAYTEPEKELGMRFDAFVYLKDHWVFAPKMWRAFPREGNRAVAMPKSSEPPAPAEAKSNAEFKDGFNLLSKRLGNWQESISIILGDPAERRSAPLTVTRNLASRAILKGRYLEMVSSDEKFESKSIVTYESETNTFRIFTFDSGSDTSSWTGRQTSANTIEFEGKFTDGRTGVSQWTFESDDKLTWKGTVFTSDNKIFAAVSGEVIRQKE